MLKEVLALVMPGTMTVSMTRSVFYMAFSHSMHPGTGEEALMPG